MKHIKIHSYLTLYNALFLVIATIWLGMEGYEGLAAFTGFGALGLTVVWCVLLTVIGGSNQP